MSLPRIIGDIGGTNARFALARDGAYRQVEQLAVADYPSFQDALGTYLDRVPDALRPDTGAFAVAGPVSGGRARLTNSRWAFSEAELGARFDLSAVAVISDFAGTAMGIPFLDKADRLPIGPPVPGTQGPIAIIGPGTGLGISALLPNGADWTLVSGEGGHATIPAATYLESVVLDHLRSRWDHLSAERVLSGAGLISLYQVCCAEADRAAPLRSPVEVITHALDRDDADCVQAVGLFCAMLGTVAGNLALTLGAIGGVYITGDLAPRLYDALKDSLFRTRFEAKGRLKSYMQSIPTYLVLEKAPALLGLANLQFDANTKFTTHGGPDVPRPPRSHR